MQALFRRRWAATEADSQPGPAGGSTSSGRRQPDETPPQTWGLQLYNCQFFFFPQTKLHKRASIILKQTKPAFLVFVLGCFFLGRYFSEGFLVLFLLLWSAEDVLALWYEIENTEVWKGFSRCSFIISDGQQPWALISTSLFCCSCSRTSGF